MCQSDFLKKMHAICNKGYNLIAFFLKESGVICNKGNVIRQSRAFFNIPCVGFLWFSVRLRVSGKGVGALAGEFVGMRRSTQPTETFHNRSKSVNMARVSWKYAKLRKQKKQ